MLAENAPAKLNLALHVRGRRADGYHELETIFAFIGDGDVVHGEIAAHDSFAIEGPFAPGLQGAADNLVTSALAHFRAAFGRVDPVRLILEKNLPVASGIGGGSADAAATLRLLVRLFAVATDDPKLFELALALGSDVPACLVGRTARGSGRGEVLAVLPPLGGLPVLLVNPLVAVSTARVFSAWDGVDRGPLPEGDAMMVAHHARNDLQRPAIGIVPVIGEVLELLGAQRGAALVRMSGSGATCFAVFDEGARCRAAHTAIAAERPGWWCLESELV